MEFSGDIGLWQRKVTEAPDGAKRRVATFEALQVAPGQAILEIGCGGGHLTRELGLAVAPGGRAVGFDLNADQLAAARRFCADAPAVELVEGDATTLPFDDSSFDSVTAVNTLEYVPDVDAAIGEIHRVLTPGGRVVLISVLWDHWVYHGVEPELNRRMLDAWRVHCPHQMLPLELPSKLAAAGFGGTRRETLTFFNGAYHENTFAYWAAKVVAVFAAGRGVPEPDCKAWLDQLSEAQREGRFGFLNVSIMTTATRM
jgi:ubiquinone/menaquinone biosynthesis C-methylase UbiE